MKMKTLLPDSYSGSRPQQKAQMTSFLSNRSRSLKSSNAVGNASMLSLSSLEKIGDEVFLPVKSGLFFLIEFLGRYNLITLKACGFGRLILRSLEIACRKPRTQISALIAN
jgi:hypothetical protein